MINGIYSFINMALYFLPPAILVLILVLGLMRYCSQYGIIIPYGKVKLRRYYCPGKLISDECLQKIVENMRSVSLRSIGSVIKYPAILADTIEERRNELSNKVILEVYKNNKIIGFSMAYISSFPHVHVGLMMVDKDYHGLGIQQLAAINIYLITLDWFCTGFYLSDLGYSSSAWRIFSENISQSYPNLYYNISKQKFHIDIAHHIMSYHRKDSRISSNATFDEESFVIINSNSPDGNGASELIPFTSTRISKNSSIAQRILEELLEVEDEQIYIGYASLFFSISHCYPILSGILTMRWIIIISMILYHTYLIPNLHWYYYTAFKIFGFEIILPYKNQLSTKPCIWISNHFSWVDLWAIKLLNPDVYVVVKKDLLDEAPEGWKRNGMAAAFNRCNFIWYDRVNKDTAARDRMRHILTVEKRPICVFSEGTSQRNGLPMKMHSGAIDLARECNVTIQPICLRYNLPIGVDKPDDVMKNALQLIRVANKRVCIQTLDEINVVENGVEVQVDIDDIRDRITTAYVNAADMLNIPHRARAGRRKQESIASKDD